MDPRITVISADTQTVTLIVPREQVDLTKECLTVTGLVRPEDADLIRSGQTFREPPNSDNEFAFAGVKIVSSLKFALHHIFGPKWPQMTKAQFMVAVRSTPGVGIQPSAPLFEQLMHCNDVGLGRCARLVEEMFRCNILSASETADVLKKHFPQPQGEATLMRIFGREAR